ncbi:MAG TPA: sigma 54-interacting transcriptional regulator [Pyrinomonadaceae bacterium]|jgi:Nif-specific regulatory protein
MNPRLIILAGLPEKETIALHLEDGESFVLGRGVECDLPIGNVAVSRQHCRISRAGENFKLEDLGSHNGTFVNNLPVQSHVLNDGDRINIGNSYVVFLTREDEHWPQTQAEFDDGSLVLNSTIRLYPYEDTDEFAPDLGALVKLGKAVNELKNAKALERRFLEIILEFIPAHHAAIILTDDDSDEPAAVSVLSRNASDTEPMQISRTVCRQILAEQVALLSNDLSDSHLGTAESLIASQITSLLCVPLNIGETKGLIYLDANDPEFRFTQNHLEQMTALSFLISAALANAESIENLRRQNELLKADLEIETNMIGDSEPVRNIFRLISKVAPMDSTVLISGESGTGKELAAKAIHQNSHRADKPYAAINCAVLNENLLESELFGYEKGSFTGAFAQKKGKLELADSGTIFLDEVAELAPNIQAKLLRVLQEREFERVGGTHAVKVNVRIIAATNRDLETEVKKGAFRQDLFFRLNVVQIKMPPLRERIADIPLLAQHFVRKHSEKCKRKVTGVSEKARQMLMKHEWPGNVRELENIIERAIVLGSDETVTPKDLPEEITGNNFFGQNEIMDFQEQLKNAKQRIILDALKKSGWNYSDAARGLGIHPNNLHRLISTLGISDEVKSKR